MRRPDWIDRAAREWPLFLAAAGLLSLLPLYLPAPRAVALDPDDRVELDRVRDLLRRGDGPRAARRLRHFLAERPRSPRGPEARVLLGRALVEALPPGEAPALREMDEAWEAYTAAAREGQPAPLVTAARRDLARQLARLGHPERAAVRLESLLKETGDRELRLDLAHAIAAQARNAPGTAASLGDAALLHVEAYLEGAPPERALAAHLARASVLRATGRNEDGLAAVDAALPGFAGRPGEANLLLERARALVRLGRHTDAFDDVDAALQGIASPRRHDEARLLFAELLARARDPWYPDVCGRLIDERSPLLHFAALTRGIHQIEHGLAKPIEELREALDQVASAGDFDEVAFDFDPFYSALTKAWEAEREDAALAAYAACLARIQRIFPRESVFLFDRARLLGRAGRLLREAGDEAAASRRYRDAADQYLEAAVSGLAGVDVTATYRLAAHALREGGFFLAAGDIHRSLYENRPKDRKIEHADLHELAKCLMEAGIYDRPSLLEPDALKTLAEFLANVPATDSLRPRAIVDRGTVLSELGRHEEAILEFREVLRNPDLDTSPASPSGEWREALLGLGKALLQAAVTGPADRAPERLREARRELREYLDRYAPPGAPAAPGAIDAAFLLARAAIAERELKAAREGLAELRRIAAEAPPRKGSPAYDTLKQARFLEGDVLLDLGEFDQAAQAYGAAIREHGTEPERLWGLVGRARAYRRRPAPRVADARRDRESARALFERQREDYEKSLGGHGAAYWRAELDDLDRELQ